MSDDDYGPALRRLRAELRFEEQTRPPRGLVIICLVVAVGSVVYAALGALLG